ncbi:MAG: hypothetical protein AABY54_09055 [Deltaproteobacteria bacterium]
MKKVVLDEYIRENKAGFTRIRLGMDRGDRPVRRIRDAEEKAVLSKLDRARWGKWIQEGRIEVVGERKFRVKL